MSTELSAKVQAALWWITSIAVSVVCCSILFVLFASYLIEVKESVRVSNERISLIQEREDRILDEIALIRKHAVFQAAMPASAIQIPASGATEAPLTLEGAGNDKAPTVVAPAVSAPAMPAPADKK